MPDMMDRVLLVLGVVLMAWGLWGIPAKPDATFALGVGMAIRPTFLGFREWHRLLSSR